MDTKLLNKYIAGDVLPEEKKEVARWLKDRTDLDAETAKNTVSS